MNKPEVSANYTKPEAKKPNYTLRRGLALGGVALAVFGTYKGGEAVIEHLTHQTYIGSETFGVANGSTVIEGAQETAADLAKKYKIDPSYIHNNQIVYESQNASTEYKKEHHTTDIQPGDSFKVTLTEGITGYNIAVDPADITPANQ